jgi:hypothetical protein
MSQERTYAGITGDWQRLLVPVKANGEELVHLQPFRGRAARKPKPAPEGPAANGPTSSPPTTLETADNS